MEKSEHGEQWSKSFIMSDSSSSESESEETSSNTNEEIADAEKKSELKSKKNRVDFSMKYDMSKANLGKAVIFNNQNYDDRVRKYNNRLDHIKQLEENHSVAKIIMPNKHSLE